MILMGLTIHYKLHLPATVTEQEVEALVRTTHRQATALVGRHGLQGIDAVQPVDPENPLSCRFVLEECGDETRGHDVKPECGWMFAVHPGQGCESAKFGLCRYPATIRVGSRTLSTGCGGWGYASFCKTQYASLHGEEHFLRCHKAAIDLVLLWEELGITVKITDEGDYWPERNEAKLLAGVGQMNRIVAAFGGALKDAADEGGPSVKSPIFQHKQFERLEAEGLNRHAAQIGSAMTAVKANVKRSPNQLGP